MPIQVVATYKRIPPPPVYLITAGADQQSICNTTVTLSATVTPIENINGHTFEWEQLSGDPVTLIPLGSPPDGISVYYVENPVDVTDKKFKFTVDKGLEGEQSDILEVFATPTTVVTSSFPSKDNNGVPSDAVTDLMVTTEALVADPTNVINPDVMITPQFIVSWSEPPDVELQPYIVGYTLYESGSPATPSDYLMYPVATFLPGDLLEYSGRPRIYQVDTQFIVNGVAPYQSSNELSFQEDFRDAVVPSTYAVDDLPDGISFPAPRVTITKYPNVVQRLESTQYSAFQMNRTTVNQYPINSVQRPETTANTSFALNDTTITRLDPGGIGGG